MAEGRKNDKGKLRFDLMPVYPLALQAEVYTLGANKYDDHNWRKGLEWSRLLGAAFRHLFLWAAGESHDPEDGQHHLASVGWIVNALMEYEITHPELDDRYKDERTLSALRQLYDKYTSKRKFDDSKS